MNSKILLITMTMFAGFLGNAMHIEMSKNMNIPCIVSSKDSLLVNIEKKVGNAFSSAMITRDKTILENIISELDFIHRRAKENRVTYWKSYTTYHLAIFYLTKGDKEKSKEEINKAIEIIDSIEDKGSEDFALLALLESFSIQFNMYNAPSISSRVKEHGKLAIRKNKSNLRGYFVLGSNDFYTPKMFGGGKKAEEYLLKAISLDRSEIDDDFSPSWGREESYDLLVKFYIQNNQWEKAKKYYQKGMILFPNSYLLNQLKPKLEKE